MRSKFDLYIFLMCSNIFIIRAHLYRVDNRDLYVL